MRANGTKALISCGKVAVGTLCTTASPLMAESLGHAGYDFVVVDLQHGENNLGDLQGMMQAVSTTSATPFVRLPANVPFYIQRALDLGAYGIVVPLVETEAEAEAVVLSLRYAPRGARSWGPVRGTLYGGADYFTKAADELMAMVMLETQQGLRNARAILSVPGIDGCFIGPNDLSISLGFAAETPVLAAAVENAIAEILDAARSAGKAAGIQTFSADSAATRIAQGFRFISVLSDLRMARSTAGKTLEALRSKRI
jgi:4-hydroxy-2-oxoheptanedioate aldolase